MNDSNLYFMEENRNQLLKTINEKLFKQVLNEDVNNNIIFVYTPPKVASTSLVSSLRLCASNKFNIIHIHDEIMLSSLIHINMQDITINEIIEYNKKLGKKIIVIDIFRNLIERKMSEYFEQISSLHFNNTEENLNNYPIQKLIDRFNKLYPYLGKHDYYKEKYNIPIPETFDFEKKYLIQYVNGITYIKLRMNDISFWGKILTDILKTDITVIKDYETKDKLIGKMYNKFKNEYKLPYSYFIELIDNPIMNYYYTKDEKDIYLNNWYKKVVHNTVVAYTKEEYDFYMKLSAENRYYNNNIQFEHYISNGCLCPFCSMKRNQLLQRVKRGENIKNEKIIHDSNLIMLELQNYKRLIIEKMRINRMINNGKIKNTINHIVFNK